MNKRNLIFFVYLLVLLFGFSVPAVAHKDGKYQVIFQINDNDEALMNLALNNVSNVIKHFQDSGKEYEIEVVTYGPGLNMLRADKSPVKDRIKSFSENFEGVKFVACENTIKAMTKKEGKKPELLNFNNITSTPSGVIHILDRQDEGWHYVKP